MDELYRDELGIEPEVCRARLARVHRRMAWREWAALFAAAALFFLAATLFGCSNLFNQHAQMMDAMRGTMRDTASRLSQSGTGQIAAGGQVIHPGIEVSGGVRYFARAEYVGVAGQVTASMQGGLDRPVPEDVQAQIGAIWRNTALSDGERIALVRELLLAWLARTATTQPAADPS